MFHVPEASRDTTHPQLGTTTADGNNGAFDAESPGPGWWLDAGSLMASGVGTDLTYQPISQARTAQRGLRW